MKQTRAIFTKQAQDMFKTPSQLIMFLIFPLVAFAMTELVSKSNPDIGPNMFVTMMASISAGMALIPSVAGVIAEDIERKSLRFLMMAGVKPYQYLLGTGGYFLAAAVVTSLLFSAIGQFSAEERIKFFIILLCGTAASIVLGAAIGVVSKNQQATASLAMPVSAIIGFLPMVAQFNGGVAKFSSFLYTQQINVVVNDFSADIVKPLLVVAANICVFVVLFAAAYTKKGLKRH